MAEYLVRIPFSSYRRGVCLDEEIEEAPRFRMLMEGGFLERLLEDVVPGRFIVEQHFRAEGRDLEPGELVDLRDRRWRNEGTLLETGMIRRATRSDMPGAVIMAGPACSTTLHLGVDGRAAITPAVDVPPEAYKIKSWLEAEYIEKGRTTTDIGQQFGVKSQSISYWLRKHEIKTRPRGTPKSS